MNRDEVMQIAEYLDPGEGEIIFFTSDNVIMHPHTHGKQDLGPEHTDGYACRKILGRVERSPRSTQTISNAVSCPGGTNSGSRAFLRLNLMVRSGFAQSAAYKLRSGQAQESESEPLMHSKPELRPVAAPLSSLRP